MKRSILRRAAAMCLALMLAAATSVTAHAEEIRGRDRAVTFTGSALTADFSAYDFYRDMHGLLPGDTVTLRVDMKNASGDYARWYMENDTIRTLEDTLWTARDGGYSYKLAYTSNGTGARPASGTDPDPARTVTIFDSDTVGADRWAEGLYEATEDLDEFFPVCVMAPGGSGYVTLTVKLDGETQGNGYQDTMAKLRLVFATDVIPPEYIEIPDPTTVEIQDPDVPLYIPGDPVYVIDDPDVPLADIPQYATVPQTGDTIKLAVLSSVAMLAGAGCIFVIWKKRRKDGGDTAKGGGKA